MVVFHMFCAILCLKNPTVKSSIKQIGYYICTKFVSEDDKIEHLHLHDNYLLGNFQFHGVDL